ATAGTITLAGAQVRISTPQQAMDLAIAYVSEDRRKLGLALPLPIFANISLASLKKLRKPFGIIDRTAEAAMAETYRKRLAIRAPDT
ncbi:D-xylose ABC transporter ATP-binding protein, partial [Bacillus cereus group sp. Bc237]